MEHIVLTLLILCLCLMGHAIGNIEKTNKLKERVEDLEAKNKRLEEDLEIHNGIVRYYRNMIEQLNAKKYRTKLPDGTVEAVKLAMIKSHPDNGGSAEKFILYKKCYEELTQ